jgi:hypothetical protein
MRQKYSIPLALVASKLVESLKLVDKIHFPAFFLVLHGPKAMFGYGPNGQTATRNMANCTLQDHFGVENDEPAPAVVQVSGSPSKKFIDQ